MIKDFFQKDITRPIETVIKADDRDNISTEVAEYVITDEIAKKIRDFFQAYNNYAGANGVWISGFFGSGKSHLLKILSYVLENKTYNGYESGELFAEKVEDDEMLRADIVNATRIHSESILFNIDQQAQITSKADSGAILSVFYKVFYDYLGFYGSKTPVAEFEMWLSEENNWEDFKSKYRSQIGNKWSDDRRKYFAPNIKTNIGNILGEIYKDDASKYKNIIDTFRKDTRASIEDFANRVNEYIQTKPKGFRLNFFVDEVGQYISDNTKLMLNLQTIAETLATKTKGKSWILVTSQEDMETVVGDMNRSQQNDFSRIQARFKIKIPLTSANVDEVIEKRLLDKKEQYQDELEKAHQSNQAHLQSLLSFSEAGVQFKGYKSDKDFANKYPFAPYQFDLFQQCRIALSNHNAFQGKHASVGERSMLGVFQQVVKHIKDKDEKALVSFDLMFEGIRSELRGDIQQSLQLGEKNLTDEFEIKVLKTLFLVKYFDSFKTTMRNISVLLIDDINIDLSAHDKKIEEALTVLENQSYIQRNGDIYEFLTDVEKDIEKEIKDTEIDEQAVTTLLNDILFNEIIKDNRISYLQNKQAYEFTNKINGSTFGREKELEIELITSDHESNESVIQSQTMGSTSMKLLLSPAPTFSRDLRMFIKTAKYEKQNRGNSTNPQIMRILQEKSFQNVNRKRNLISLANKALAEAKVFVNGSHLEINPTSDGKLKVINAFQHLVASVYPNLRMLKGLHYSEETLKTTMFSKQDDLFSGDDATISEAETEILNLINRRKKQSDRTSLNDVKNEFTKKPYGWYPNAIWTLIAFLYKRGKIELSQNTNLLENEEVVNALMNSSNHSSTLLEPQATFDTSSIKKLKEIYKDAFDETCPYREAKDVASAFKNKLQQMSIDVNKLLAERSSYPFLDSLQAFSENLEKWSNKEYSFFLQNQDKFEDELLDTKEDLLDPIKRFMNGEQRNIFDDVKKLLEGNTANFEFIQGDELETLKTLVKSKTPYKGNAVQLAKAAKDDLSAKVIKLIEDEKEKAIKKAEDLIGDIKNRKDFESLETEEKEQVITGLEKRKKSIENERFVANIRQSKNYLAELHTNALNLMQSLLAKSEDDSGDGKAAEPKAQYKLKSNVHIDFDRKELQNEEDVIQYVEAVKEAYLKQIKNNFRITL